MIHPKHQRIHTAETVRIDSHAATTLQYIRNSMEAATAKAEAAAKPVKTRKLSFKDTQELAGMEAKIHEVEAEIARIEGLFATPDFHRNHAVQSKQLVVDLEKHRENLTQLFARWEELEALKVAVEKV